MSDRTQLKPLCDEPGCVVPARKRGYCDSHYSAHIRSGLLTILYRPTPGERFLAKVDVNGPTMPHMDTNCHVWTGATVNGYGRFFCHVDGKKAMPLATRWGWEHWNGVIPEATPNVLHRCDNPPCVRLSHLFLGTHADNVADKIAKGRQRVGSDSPLSILTEDDVRSIRERHANGERVGAFAREYGMSTAAISNAISRKTWKHVD